MKKSPQLSKGELELVERLARFYEAQGAPRIGGRILGLLMLVDNPMSLDDLATTLKASRASISTNARLLDRTGLIEHHTFAGDRRDYYRFSDRAWELRIESGLATLRKFRQIAEHSLTAVPSANTIARKRLEEMRAFCLTFEEIDTDGLRKWRKQMASMRGKRAD